MALRAGGSDGSEKRMVRASSPTLKFTPVLLVLAEVSGTDAPKVWAKTRSARMKFRKEVKVSIVERLPA